MDDSRLRVLLIEDDEDDYVLVQDLFSEITSVQFELDWVTSYDAALEMLDRSQHDVYLVDYLLGERTGLELLKEVAARHSNSPVILLTGQGNYQVDMKAMKTGAADYLVKGQINAPLLERSIRYALERKRSEEALRESEKQLRYLSSKLLSVQEDERCRLAQELHDSTGQTLAAIKLGVEMALKASGAEKTKVIAQSLEPLVPVIQNAIEDIRRIYMNLRPTILDDFGIIAALGWFCRELEKMVTNLRIEKQIDIREEDIPKALKIVIFRIVQEALSNVIRHSGANFARFSLKRMDNRIELTVEDSGTGFDTKKVLSAENIMRGLGLASMRERTELSGGHFTVESNRGKGTLIRASWPYD